MLLSVKRFQRGKLYKEHQSIYHPFPWKETTELESTNDNIISTLLPTLL
jgi:hypothetical protein